MDCERESESSRIQKIEQSTYLSDVKEQQADGHQVSHNRHRPRTRALRHQLKALLESEILRTCCMRTNSTKSIFIKDVFTQFTITSSVAEQPFVHSKLSPGFVQTDDKYPCHKNNLLVSPLLDALNWLSTTKPVDAILGTDSLVGSHLSTCDTSFSFSPHFYPLLCSHYGLKSISKITHIFKIVDANELLQQIHSHSNAHGSSIVSRDNGHLLSQLPKTIVPSSQLAPTLSHLSTLYIVVDPTILPAASLRQLNYQQKIQNSPNNYTQPSSDGDADEHLSSIPLAESLPEETSVYVDNLPAYCSAGRLKRRAEIFGTVVQIKLPQLPRIQGRLSQGIPGGRALNSGFGFVQFVSKTAARRFYRRYATNSRLRPLHRDHHHHNHSNQNNRDKQGKNKFSECQQGSSLLTHCQDNYNHHNEQQFDDQQSLQQTFEPTTTAMERDGQSNSRNEHDLDDKLSAGLGGREQETMPIDDLPMDVVADNILYSDDNGNICCDGGKNGHQNDSCDDPLFSQNHGILDNQDSSNSLKNGINANNYTSQFDDSHTTYSNYEWDLVTPAATVLTVTNSKKKKRFRSKKKQSQHQKHHPVRNRLNDGNYSAQNATLTTRTSAESAQLLAQLKRIQVFPLKQYRELRAEYLKLKREHFLALKEAIHHNQAAIIDARHCSPAYVVIDRELKGQEMEEAMKYNDGETDIEGATKTNDISGPGALPTKGILMESMKNPSSGNDKKERGKRKKIYRNRRSRRRLLSRVEEYRISHELQC